MLSSFYTAASGILTNQREIDIIGTNLTNIQTPGYKTQRTIVGSFDQELLVAQDAHKTTLLSPSMSTSTIVEDVATIYDTGLIDTTGRSFDFAINGEGFYAVADAQGNLSYTRNGGFQVDENGNLIVPGFGTVQGQSGNITLTDINITVLEDGSIFDSNGAYVDKIAVMVPAENTTLELLPNGMFSPVEGQMANAGNVYTINQGALELSNVDMNLEMTKLIEAQRAFQACSTALQVVDEMNSKAASQIGSIR